jgi:hypothetical protein
MNHSAVGTHLDFDLLRVFRVAQAQQGFATAWADTLLRRQFEEFLTDGQMGVIPSLGTRVPRLLASVPLGSRGVVLGIIQLIGAIVPRLGFGASSKQIGFELTFFAFELFDFLLQHGDALQGIAMATLPIPALLAEREILALQAMESSA